MHKNFDKAWFYGSRGYLHKLISAFSKSVREDILALPDAFILYDSAEIARREGARTKEVRLAWHSAILNCAADSKAAEQLRQRVEEHHLLKESLNVIPEHWHEGWKTGEVLRYRPGNDAVGTGSTRISVANRVKRGCRRSRCRPWYILTCHDKSHGISCVRH